MKYFPINPLLRAATSSEPDGAVLPLSEKVDGLRLNPRAGGWTEAVEALTIDMNPGTVNLRRAPGRPCWLPAVDPVSAGAVSDSVEGEGEHAGLAAGRPAGHHAAGGRGCRRGGGGCSRRGGGGGGGGGGGA